MCDFLAFWHHVFGGKIQMWFKSLKRILLLKKRTFNRFRMYILASTWSIVRMISENLLHSINGMARTTSPRCLWTNSKGRTFSLPSAFFKHSTSIKIRSGEAVGTKCLMAIFLSPSLHKKTFEKVPSPTVRIV